jgi:hypothetical protein
MNNFNSWWATIEPGFSEVQPVLMLAFKELAEKAWNEGYDEGREDGCAEISSGWNL